MTTTRRGFLGLIGGSAAVTALSSCGAGQSSESPLSSTRIGDGPVGVTIWVQDFAATVEDLRRAAHACVKKSPELNVTIQVIPYANLRTKVVPAVSAGTEADLIIAYNSWLVAYDISRMFLALDRYVGGRAALRKLVFANALEATAAPGGHLYYLPHLSGMNGSTVTLNRQHVHAAGIDYHRLSTWDDLVAAAQELTIVKHGRMERAGLSPIGTYLDLIQSWIWQQGGDFYDRDHGRWTLSTDHGREAIGRLADLFGKDRVCSFDLLQPTTGTEDFLRQRVSANTAGTWQIGSLESADPSLKCDGITTPPISGAKSSVLYGDEIGVTTLSKRLEKDHRKRRLCIELLQEMLTPDAELAITETYTGAPVSKKLFADPRIKKTRYGLLTKRIAEQTWPRLRFSKDRVSDKSAAQTEIERGLRGEISLREALANADSALNEAEQLAFQRQHRE